MNIFALAPTPQESARMHCDQHLHKMILESAQMVSTAFHARGFKLSWLYKPAYEKHPCTVWAATKISNVVWLLELAKELEVIREELGHPYHSSSEIIKFCYDYLQEEFGLCSDLLASPRIFCGPAFLKLQSKLLVEEKYQLYYQYKHKQWLDTRQPMSYRNRPLPTFLSPFKDSINHDTLKTQ
jgi:hypothetical protein